MLNDGTLLFSSGFVSYIKFRPKFRAHKHAIIREDFREAIRVYFTMILQELIALDLIKWKREKTNHQYIQELKDIQIKSSQSKCTRLFEIVWYGEYEIDRTKFEELKPHFISFITTLKSKKID